MAYCNVFNRGTIELMTAAAIETTLDYCVEHCDKYFQCDTVAFMDDKLKEKLGE